MHRLKNSYKRKRGNAAHQTLRQYFDESVKNAVNQSAEIAAKVAIEKVAEEYHQRLKQEHDRQLHNVKLLLKNYRALNEHAKNALYNVEQLELEKNESLRDIIALMNPSDCSDLSIESVKKTARRTKLLLAHVNKMIEIYGILCERSNRDDEQRRFRVIKALYIDSNQQSLLEVAAAENIDKRTVYKDIDTAVSMISTLMFGVNGIETKADY
ncbi:MAG: hypothetical protein LBM93_01730 [Oscillospiraceae bacterium]|jgi:hypothetical protein|nr:hypothetical protein [Oscillospiraceae bacterium]